MDAILKAFVFGLGLVTGVLGGRFVYLRLEQWPRLSRCVAAALPGLVVLWFACWAPILLEAPYFDWNAARLAPSFALRHGYPIYYGPEDGPISGHIYGPIPVLCYWPATLAGTPSLAIMLGSVISSTFYFLPVVWLLVLQHRREKPSWLASLTGGLFVWLLTVFSPALKYAAFNVHVDAVALGFAACAFALLPPNPGEARWSQFLPSALCAALSLWSKQTMVPLLLALPLGLAWQQGARPAIRLSAALFTALTVVSLLCLGLFGFRQVWFNIWTVPAHHPWFVDFTSDARGVIRGTSLLPRFRVLTEAFFNLARHLVWPAGLLVLTCLAQRKWARPDSATQRGPLSVGWLALTGLLMISTSCLGRVKVGGDINAYSYAVYFLMLAAALNLTRSVDLALTLFPLPEMGRGLKWAGLVCAVSFSLLWWKELSVIAQKLNLPPSSTDEACEIMQRTGGGIYFPWQPLSHLFMDGKMYHYPYGLYDRAIAGYPITSKHLHDFIPAEAHMIGFLRKDEMAIMTNALPEFSQLQTTTNFPAWVFFAKPQQGSR